MSYELVVNNFTLPFPLYLFQQQAANELAPLPSNGVYFEPGLGKTATSTVIALYKLLKGADRVVVIMPPLLISQWARWLGSIKRGDGRSLTVSRYRGSPAHRKTVSFDVDFVLMGIQIFKKDMAYIEEKLQGKGVHVILDEAQCIKDVGTSNYKTYRDFIEPRSHTLLTGTPLNKPEDAYAYIKLVAPTVYRNLNQFNQIHIVEKDFFGRPLRYGNLDLLKENLLINADRKTKEEVLIHLPECVIQPIEYDLDPKHLALYRRIAAEQLLKLPDGDKIDLTQATALYHALGQIIMQWSYFAQDDSLTAEGFKLVDEVLDELGSAKLVVFGNYVRTNEALVKRFKCPGVWGGIGAKEKDKAINKFIDDDKCRMIVMNPIAGGVGVEGLQHVCSDAIYVEPPITPSHFTQSLSRVHRDGQTKPVIVRVMMANGTMQHHVAKRLSEVDTLIQPLQGSRAMLQAALFGE